MITLAPGYVLSRNKEKINVTITDEFFKEGSTNLKVGLALSPFQYVKYVFYSVSFFTFIRQCTCKCTVFPQIIAARQFITSL